MGEAAGFAYEERKSGEVAVSHHGRFVTVLRGAKAKKFLDDVSDGSDDQELMARVTGNYRRGNERTAKRHPRNR